METLDPSDAVRYEQSPPSTQGLARVVYMMLPLQQRAEATYAKLDQKPRNPPHCHRCFSPQAQGNLHPPGPFATPAQFGFLPARTLNPMPLAAMLNQPEISRASESSCRSRSGTASVDSMPALADGEFIGRAPDHCASAKYPRTG